MTRRVSIFGATGSIGANTIDLIRRRPNDFDVVALSGGRNIAQLAKDAIELGAEAAVTAFDDEFDALKEALAGSNVKAMAGEGALIEAAGMPADWIMSGIVGAAGLAPGLEALKQGTTLALANKESLVAAGPLLMQTARDHGATILPVDSEHSAVFQALIGEDPACVERVIITASGGAFRDWALEDLAGASVAQASSHPNWAMGQRITIDSASMFNKAMELIETKEFFGFEPSQIEAVIHPESLIHALVGFQDGALMAHVGPHDMRHAIGFALNYPKRAELPVERLDLAKIGAMTFREPEAARYPALAVAYEVMALGGMAGAIFNAAKETALDGFIAGQIGFTEMTPLVCEVIEVLTAQSRANAAINLDLVLEADQMARKATLRAMQKRQR